ncbi:hypothetical protein ACFPL7_12230 [Dongia soli]|uniref:Uncharacterized protein n=1 Tax=Dongia soli TaxID=600628 RepID=A0ABU5EGZ0_9PROT|nr:hypothetical protein [Dongia soli]MDY0885420.1 hypothetical protein [Dongia soli]
MRLEEYLRRQIRNDFAGETLAGYLKNSHRGTPLFAGDEIVLNAVREGTLSGHVLYSWLTFYKTTKNMPAVDGTRIVKNFLKNYRSWRAEMERGSFAPEELVLSVYESCRKAGRSNYFVLATKAAWLIASDRVSIYDSLVEGALHAFASEKLIKKAPVVNRDKNCLGGDEAVEATMVEYSNFLRLTTRIARNLKGDLDAYVIENAKQIPVPLHKNHLRIVDELLWGIGQSS